MENFIFCAMFVLQLLFTENVNSKFYSEKLYEKFWKFPEKEAMKKFSTKHFPL